MSMDNIVFVSYCNQCNIEFDKTPDFTLIVFCYCDNKTIHDYPYFPNQFLNIKTECKGDLIYEQYRILKRGYFDYKYVAMYDDDIAVKVSDIERTFKIAEENNLDLFAPSLSRRSHGTFPFTYNSGSGVRETEWIEIMMPHFSKKFMDEFSYHIEQLSSYNLKSGWGYDIRLFPHILNKINGKCAVIDDVQVTHKNPITSNSRTFSNGLTAGEELNVVNHYANQL